MDDVFSDSDFEQTLKAQMGMAQGDRSLGVRFFTDEVRDEAKSTAEGRPVYKTVEFCEIRVPGDRDVLVQQVKYMSPDPRERFPEVYARFKAKMTGADQLVGTPLKRWGLMEPARACEYAELKVFTVEQLAGLSDQNAQRIHGAVKDRETARDFLAMAQGQAPLAQLRAELERSRAEIDSLKDQLEALKAQKPERKARQ